MDEKVTEYFNDVIDLAAAIFEPVEFSTDMTPARAILRIQGQYGIYRVLVTELFSDEVRKYRYYVLFKDRVEAGFDNSPEQECDSSKIWPNWNSCRRICSSPSSGK